MDGHISPSVFFFFKWLTLTSKMHFMRCRPEVASCSFSSDERRYATLGMRLWWKYIKSYWLVYHYTSHFPFFLSYLRNFKRFEGEISDLHLSKNIGFYLKLGNTLSVEPRYENVIGLRAFKPRKSVLKGMDTFLYVKPRRLNFYLIRIQMITFT